MKSNIYSYTSLSKSSKNCFREVTYIFSRKIDNLSVLLLLLASLKKLQTKEKVHNSGKVRVAFPVCPFYLVYIMSNKRIYVVITQCITITDPSGA